MPRLARRPAALAVAVLLALLAVAVLLLAGPGRSAAQSGDEPEAAERFAGGTCAKDAVRFGVVLPVGDAEGRAAADRLTQDLSEGLGCRAVTVVYATQAQLITAIGMHDVDVAQLDPASTIVAARVTGAAPVGAYALDADTPARARPSEIWVRRSGGVRRLADLRDRPIALGPRGTAGGDLDPRAALLAAGVRVRGDDRAAFTDDDASALDARRERRVDAAVTRGTPTGETVAGLRRIWTETGPLGDVVVLRPGIPKALRRLVVSAVRKLPGAALAPLAARQGIVDPAPLITVPLDLYAPLGTRLDDLTAAGLIR